MKFPFFCPRFKTDFTVRCAIENLLLFSRLLDDRRKRIINLCFELMSTAIFFAFLSFCCTSTLSLLLYGTTRINNVVARVNETNCYACYCMRRNYIVSKTPYLNVNNFEIVSANTFEIHVRKIKKKKQTHGFGAKIRNTTKWWHFLLLKM